MKTTTLTLFKFLLALSVFWESSLSCKDSFRMGTVLISSYYKTLCFYRNQKNYTTNLPTICHFPEIYSVANGTTQDREFCRKIIKNFKPTPNQFKRLHSIPKKFFTCNSTHEKFYNIDTWNLIDKVNGFKYYEEFTKIISEITQKTTPPILREMGYTSNKQMPVIHYRLSDVPFCRHSCHHLQYYAFYDYALKCLKQRGVNVSDVLVLTSFSHKLGQNNNPGTKLCCLYFDDFCFYLSQKGHKVHTQSKSVLEDYATMALAPALISSTGVYSLCAGLANPSNFICGYTGRERPKNSYTKLSKSWFMLPIKPLLHQTVNKYSHTSDVFQKLRTPIKLPKNSNF